MLRDGRWVMDDGGWKLHDGGVDMDFFAAEVRPWGTVAQVTRAVTKTEKQKDMRKLRAVKPFINKRNSSYDV